jgi:hypothetical protein
MKRMTKTEYRAIIDELGLTQVAAGAFFDVDARTSRRWALGGVIPGPVAILLRYMAAKKLKPEDVRAMTEAKWEP